MGERVLIVEDAKMLVDELKEFFESVNLLVPIEWADTVELAETRLRSTDYTVLIVDLDLPTKDGQDPGGGYRVLECAEQYCPLATPIVMTQLGSSEQLLIRGMRLGVRDWIVKSSDHFCQNVLEQIRAGIDRYRTNKGFRQILEHYALFGGCPLHAGQKACHRYDDIRKGYEANNVFCAIPCTGYGDQRDAIRKALDSAGLTPIIEEEEITSVGILCNICCKIRMSPYGIVEVSHGRPNLSYELGLMHALSRNVAVLDDATRGDPRPSDVLGTKWLRYKLNDSYKTADLTRRLCDWLLQNVPFADKAALRQIQEGALRKLAE